MPGILESLQQVLTLMQRVSDLEKRHEREVKEAKDGLGSLRTEVRTLDRRLVVLETRYDGLAQQSAIEARAAAQSAATMAVAGELRAIGERIVRLETAGGPPAHDRSLLPPG